MNIFKKRKRKTTINLEFPTSWEAMSLENFKDVCNILAHPRTREETLFLCLCKLSGIVPDNPEKYDVKKLKDKMPFIIDGKSYIITASNIAAACKKLSYIMDDIGLPPCPLKNVDTKLYGISFDAYFRADSFISRATAEKNEGYLKDASKALTGGQKRKLLPWERKAMVIWWNGVKRYLMGKYPSLFTEGDSISNKTQADILQDLLSVVNNNQPQQNESILKCEVHSVLYSLNKIYEDANKRNASHRP